MSTSTPSSSDAGGAPAGRPGRYQRSASGLIGAMIILVLAVLVFIAFRGIVRDNPDSPPLEAVDYAELVTPASSQTGWPVVVPPTLPSGWIATSARWEGAPGAFWHLGLLTDDQQYVGIEQAASTPRRMVDAYVGDGATRAGTTTLPVPGGGTATWQRWSDGSDGDLGLSTRVGEQTLLVVTTLSEQQVRPVIGSLRLQE